MRLPKSEPVGGAAGCRAWAQSCGGGARLQVHLGRPPFRISWLCRRRPFLGAAPNRVKPVQIRLPAPASARFNAPTRRGETPMPIYYPDILDQQTPSRTFTYNDKDVMLYALGIGLGADPMDEKELAFVYERNLKVVPTAATVLASAFSRSTPGREPGPLPAGHRPSQINYLMMLHGEQKVELHKPLPPTGTFIAEGRTVGAWDKGKDKGAVVVNETTWSDEKGEKIATLTGAMFARGDGGFGG